MKGTTSLLMFPIYGCASLILPVYKKLKSLPALLRGSLYTAGFYLAEFTSGSILQAFHMCPWDYSGVPQDVYKRQMLSIPLTWPVGQGVKTSPSHGENTSSILVLAALFSTN